MKPLTRCPQCAYPLKGLPADHRCPECGFEYDANAAIWEYRLSKKEIVLYVVGSSLLIGMMATDYLSTPFGRWAVESVSSLLLVSLFTIALYRGFRTRRAGYAVCTTRQGVWIKIGRQLDLYPWAKIQGVFWNLANKSAGLDVNGRTRPVYIPRVFHRQPEFEEFKLEVRRRKQAEEERSCSGS